MDSEKLFDLSGKLALITGASRGIGAEAAKTLARFGARVILSSRKREGLDGIAQEITKEGFEATVRPCHNGDLSQINSLFEELDREGESVDILVNNAGVLRDRTLYNMEESDWDVIMEVHLKGHYNCTRPLVRYIRDNNVSGCRIINMSSVSGLFGNFGQSNYGAAKMGMIGLMNCLKIEGQKYNVFSSAVAPVALSRMTDSLFPEGIGERFMPEYVTPAVIYLASEESQNGAIIGAGAGVFTRFRILETMGLALGTGNIAAGWDSVSDMDDARELFSGPEQTIKILEQADKS